MKYAYLLIIAATLTLSSDARLSYDQDLESISDEDIMVLDARRRPGFAAYNLLEKDYMDCMKKNGCAHKVLDCQISCHEQIEEKNGEVARAKLEAAKIEAKNKIAYLLI